MFRKHVQLHERIRLRFNIFKSDLYDALGLFGSRALGQYNITWGPRHNTSNPRNCTVCDESSNECGIIRFLQSNLNHKFHKRFLFETIVQCYEVQPSYEWCK